VATENAPQVKQRRFDERDILFGKLRPYVSEGRRCADRWTLLH
jgi:hypothetical protein